MHGLIVLDKPAGITSLKALEPLKRLLGKRVRVGHAGTLDPFATGVLLALTGDATRLSGLAMGLPKTYDAVVRFGAETTTLDPEGEVVTREDPGRQPPDRLADAARSFVGEIEQVPPAYSALNIGGRRAHRLARAGKDVPLAARTVRVHELEILETSWPDLRIRVRCGAGTYIRSLARDLGRAVGLPAHLAALRRTHIGPFSATESIPVVAGEPLRAEAVEPAVLPLVRIARCAGLPEVPLDRPRAMAYVRGQTIPDVSEADRAKADETVAVVDEVEDLLLGLGARTVAGGVRPVRVFASAQARLAE